MKRCRRCEPVPEEVRRAADLLERRWLLSILYAALEGAVRFNEFRAAVTDVPPTTLSQRLRELERAGVVERRVVAASPPFAEYRLTAAGRGLRPMVEALERWTALSAASRR
jgi:DNA-binding HxlR family transcriptional regulator